jgi:glycosyltransferase involved in cell wall biosynthesis
MKGLYLLSGISSPAGWGTEFIQNLVVSLSKKGVKATIISPLLEHSNRDWRQWVKKQEKRHGVRIVIVGTPGWLKKRRILHLGAANLLSTLAALKLLSRENYDFIHEFSSVPLILLRSLLFKLVFKIPTIFTLSVYNRTFLGKFKWFKIFDFARYYVVPVEELEDAFLKLGIEPEKIFQIPPGINLEPFKKKAGRLKNLPQDKFILTYYGTLTREKGVTDLLEAYMSLNQSLRSRVVLLLAVIWRGSPDHQKIKKMIFSLRQKNIKLWEKYFEIPTLLASSDAVVLPQRTGHGTTIPPISLIEALASGKPIIATNIIGSREVIKSGAGYLVSPDNHRDLSRAIKKVCTSCSGSREKPALSRFKLSRVVDQYFKLYSKLAFAGKESTIRSKNAAGKEN